MKGGSLSNLGGYQAITTLIKSVGGPESAKKLAVAAGVALFVAGGATYAGIQKVTPVVKEQAVELLAKWRRRDESTDELAGSVFTVTSAAESDQGVSFGIGDAFRVLDRDTDAVLIELIGNENNPWVIPADLLAQISDFPVTPRPGANGDSGSDG